MANPIILLRDHDMAAVWDSVVAKTVDSGASYIEPCLLDIYPDSKLRLSYASDLFEQAS
jgi:hypothetical protein